MYRELIVGMIERYGRACVITPDNGEDNIRVKAIINPILYKQRMYLNDV